MGLISVGSPVRFLKQRRVGTPLDVDRIADHEGVLGYDLESAGSALRWRFDDLGEHLTKRGLPTDNLSIGPEELNVIGELGHQARPVAGAERSHVLFNDLGRSRLALKRRHGLAEERRSRKNKSRKAGNGVQTK